MSPFKLAQVVQIKTNLCIFTFFISSKFVSLTGKKFYFAGI